MSIVTGRRLDYFSKKLKEEPAAVAMRRVFRGEIKILSSTSAELYIPLNVDVNNMGTGEDWLKEGDLFFCDVNPDGAAYDCRPTTFYVVGKNEMQNLSALYTTNYVSSNLSQKTNYITTPYISFYTGDALKDNRKGFTILRYKGFYEEKYNFQDLLNGYTYCEKTTYSNNVIDALASQSIVYNAYIKAAYNALSEHAYASSDNIGTTEEEFILDCYADGVIAYLMFVESYNTSTGEIYGAETRLIIVPFDSSTKNVTVLSLGKTTNAGYTITAGNSKLSIKASSATYLVNVQIFRLG